MSALKDIIIQYSGGNVSEATYVAYTQPQKSNYLKYLTELSKSDYADAQWKISYEIYVPSGVVLQIPKNVTLVADGGLFSGTGTLAGNFTKIEAGFKQLFESRLNFKRSNGGIYAWDVKLSYPEWFGFTSVTREAIDDGNTYFKDLIGDDSVRIQKAIDILNAPYSTDWFNFNGSSGQLYAGGRVVCKPYSIYNIQKTLDLPLGVSFDGGNSNFIYDLSPGMYMFKVNMDMNVESDKWKIDQRGQMATISNIRMINQSNKSDAYGIYSGSQVCTFENIESHKMCQTFKRHHEYLDNLTLRNFNIAFGRKSSDNRYQVDISYIGDNLLLDNLAFTFDNDVYSNAIRVNGCGGGLIQRITNGTIEIKNSKALTLSGVHQESGTIIIENSQMEINGFCHFKHPGIPAIQIRNRAGSYEQRPIQIRNGMILYNHEKHSFEEKELDINMGWITGAVKIDNVFRSFQRGWTEASNLYGIRVNNNSFMKNQAANSISSYVIGNSDVDYDSWAGVMFNNMISYQVPQTSIFGDNWKNSEFKEANFELGKYKYEVAIVLDRTRNIGYKSNENFHTTIDSKNETVVISFYRHYYLGMYIRLYREKIGDNKIYYIDVPVCTSHNIFYDFGEKIQFGEKWKSIDKNNSVELSKIIPQNCSNYQSLGTNVVVKMPERPDLTRGTWGQGDMIYLTSENKYITI